jgi:capsular exopolysaccharide synthesis family protein
LSKVYEAVKKAAEERERTGARTVRPAVAPPDGVQAGDGGAEDDYQKLRANLVSVPVPSVLHTILLVSPRHGEGTTTVAVGLATALARERDTRVLLVEGNLRSPSFCRLFALTSEVGVLEFASGQATPEALAIRLEQLNLSVIAAGGAARADTNVAIVDVLIGRLQSQFDFIIIDGPPVNSYADASMLATKVDGVILVVEADRTPVVEAEIAKRQLDRVGARILGVVLNRRRSYIPAFLEGIFFYK